MRSSGNASAVGAGLGLVLMAVSGGLGTAARAGAFEPLQNFYQGPYGFFTHWSSVTEPRSGAASSLAYSVCNVDGTKKPLYFYWDRPAFGTGWSYPLAVGSCATITRTAKKFKKDDKALITFT